MTSLSDQMSRGTEVNDRRTIRNNLLTWRYFCHFTILRRMHVWCDITFYKIKSIYRCLDLSSIESCTLLCQWILSPNQMKAPSLITSKTTTALTPTHTCLPESSVNINTEVTVSQTSVWGKVDNTYYKEKWSLETIIIMACSAIYFLDNKGKVCYDWPSVVILASDWSILIMWPRYRPFIG